MWVGLEKAHILASEHGVEISTCVADLADYEFGSDCWDGVVSIFAHVPPQLRINLHSQVVNALKKGGVFILEAYTERQLEMDAIGGPPASGKDMLMSLNGLQSELKLLDFIIGRELDRIIFEGTYHRGESAVVQVVAYKN